jgi:hypothetical protein
MGWPNAADFSEAVQTPSLAFRDAELQSGQPELNHLGLPKPRSGGFAVVFKLRCGSRDWAVKCFTRDFADQQQRYLAISSYLAQKHLPYTVGFRYLADGIRTRGQTCPVLKMEWVEGETLREYVERHLSQPQALRALAAQWAEMVNVLHAASVAHGDLQDRNVIIVHGTLRLIDYDGMFVPGLAGYASHEIGAKHYQHPLRTENDFGPYLDNFSAWVVYLSLLALAAQPELWWRFGGEDERLILQHQDYEQPDKSPVLKILETSPDQEVRSVARLFKSLAYLKPEDIPSFDGQIGTASVVSQSAGSSWLADHVSQHRPEPRTGRESYQKPATTSDGATDPSWILESLSQQTNPQLVAFKHSAVPERISIALSIAGVAILVVMSHLSICGFYLPVVAIAIASVSNAVFLVARYLSESGVKVERAVAVDLKILVFQQRTKQKELDRALRQTAKVHNELQATRDRLDKKRTSLKEEEGREILTTRRTVHNKLRELDQKIGEIGTAETRELSDALSRQQRHHVESFLRRSSIANAKIPTVGQALKLALMTSGYRTALDIDSAVERVPGIGPARRAHLKSWRDQIGSAARASMRGTLEPNEEAAIRRKYRDRHDTLRFERYASETQLAAKETEIREIFKRRAATIDDEFKQARERCDEQIKNIDQGLSQTRKELFRLNWEAAKLQRQVESFANIRLAQYLARVFWAARGA